MNVLERFWKKDDLIQKTFEIESNLFDEIEYLSENVYDASISKIINACVDYLIETENIKLYKTCIFLLTRRNRLLDIVTNGNIGIII